MKHGPAGAEIGPSGPEVGLSPTLPELRAGWVLRGHAGIVGVAMLFLVATTLFNVLHPLWEAPDEPAHFTYVRFIAENHRLPAPDEGAPGVTSELHQVPLYYLIEAAAVGWIDDQAVSRWQWNPYLTWPDHPARMAFAIHRQEEQLPWSGYVLAAHLARLVSSLMGLGTVLATYALALRLLGKRGIATGTAALVAFTPGFVLDSAMVNNDNGVTLASALLLLHLCDLVMRGKPTWRDGVVSGALLAVATLMKLNALTLGAAVAIAWLLVLRRGGRLGWRQTITAALPAPLMFALLFGWWPLWLGDKLRLMMGDAGLGAGERTLLPNLGNLSALTPKFFATVFETYWGVFNWTGELRLLSWQFIAIACACALAGFGLVRLLWQRAWRAYPAATRDGLLVLLAAAVVSFHAFLARWINLPMIGVDHGRFLYPIVPAVGIFLAIGLAGLFKYGRVLIAAFALMLAVFAVAFPLTVSARVFPPLAPVWGIFDGSVVQRPLGLAYENGLVGVGTSAPSWEATPGGTFAFSFYWRSQVDQTVDWWAAFRLKGPDGEVRTSDHAVPQSEAFPPRLWRAGETIVDQRQLKLPPDAPPGEYRLEVRLLDANAANGVRATAGPGSDGGWAEAARLRVRPASGPDLGSASAPLATFGGNLTLLGKNVPPRVRAGEKEACVDLVWQAVAAPGADYHVSLQILDGGGKLVSQHDGLPYGGLYPPTRWEVGEVVPDGHCLPVANLSPGTYRLVLVVYDPADGKRLPVDGGGSSLDLGTIAVE